MSQLIACAAQDGILLAGDSRGVFFEPGGEERFISLDRIIPYSSHIVLASAGASEAHDLCKEFADFAQGENLTEVNALIEAVVPYFTGKVNEVRRKMCEKLPLNPIINMYLMVAGYFPPGRGSAFRHLGPAQASPDRIQPGDPHLHPAPAPGVGGQVGPVDQSEGAPVPDGRNVPGRLGKAGLPGRLRGAALQTGEHYGPGDLTGLSLPTDCPIPDRRFGKRGLRAPALNPTPNPPRRVWQDIWNSASRQD